MKTYMVLTASILLQISGVARAGSISFEFQADGTLPSQGGATYFGVGIAEAAAFSTSGGILHQTTFGTGDPQAFYLINDIFDSSLDTSIEWRARINRMDNGQLGANVQLEGGGHLLNFYMTTSGILWTPDINFGPIAGGSAFDGTMFHVFRVDYTAATAQFALSLDGIAHFAGTAAVDPRSNEFGWGDPTPTGGSADADWDYVRLTNSIPEPSTTMLLLLGLGAIGKLRTRLSKRGGTAA